MNILSKILGVLPNLFRIILIISLAITAGVVGVEKFDTEEITITSGWIFVILALWFGWKRIMKSGGEKKRSIKLSIFFCVLWLIVAIPGSVLAAFLTMGICKLSGVIGIWYLLAILTVWILQSFTFSTRVLEKRLTFFITAGLSAVIVFLLILFKIDQSVSQSLRVELFQNTWVAVFAFSISFLLICLASAATLSIFKLAFRKRRILFQSVYALAWLLAAVAISQVWPGLQSVMRFDAEKKQWQQVHLPQEMQTKTVSIVRMASNGDLWLALKDGGIAIQKDKEWQINKDIDAAWFGESDLGHVWLPVDKRGYANKVIQYFREDSVTNSPLIPGILITALATDRNKRLWVVQDNNRVLVLVNGQWQGVTGSANLPKSDEKIFIRDILIDKKNAVWVTTSKGVFQAEPTSRLKTTKKRMSTKNIFLNWTLLPNSPGDAERIFDTPDGKIFTIENNRNEFYWLNGEGWEKRYNYSDYWDCANGYGWAVEGNGNHIKSLSSDKYWQLIDNWMFFNKRDNYYGRNNWLTSLVDQGAGDLWVFVKDYPTIGNLSLFRFLIILLLLGLILTPALIVAFPERYLKQALVYKIENSMAEKPESLFYHLRAIEGNDKESIELWMAISGRKDTSDKAPWRSVAKAYIQFATAKNGLQSVALEKFSQEASANSKIFTGAKEIIECYRWFALAFEAKSTRAIAGLSGVTKNLLQATGNTYKIDGASFHPIESFLAIWLSKHVHNVCDQLQAYESASTIESKLVSLGEALATLSPPKPPDDLAGKLQPEILLSENLTEQWRSIINTELDRVRGPVTLRVAPASRTVPLNDEITISIVAENIGHVAADDTRIILDPRGDYTFGAGDGSPKAVKLGNLPAGAKLQADFTVRPTSQDHIRVLYRVEFMDRLRHESGSNEYADVIELLAEETGFHEIPNPYIPGTPVEARELFFGRTDVLDFAKKNLAGTKQNNVLVFHGQRRMGKTSILKQLSQVMDQKKYIFVLIDIQEYAEVSTGAFLYEIADEVAFELKQAGLAPPEIDEAAFTQGASGSFKRFIRDTAPVLNGKTLVLMFDEFETLERKVREGNVSAEVYELLRHHMQHSPHLAFIFSGTERLFELSKDYWSTLFNIALFYEVAFLDTAASKNLITRPASPHLRVDEPAVEKIVALTSGHPYFIQVICRHLVNRMNEVRRSVATVSDVDEVLQATIEGAQAPISFLYQEQASKEEQLVLSAMTDAIKPTGEAVGVSPIQQVLKANGFELSDEELLNRLNGLVDRKILAQSYLRGYFFRFTVDLVRLWIKRNQAIERLAKQ